MDLINLENIVKEYDGKKVLKNINMSIKRNKITLIMGPSGAGKTTLLNILSFLEMPDSGRHYWKDEQIEKLNVKEKRKIRRDNMSFIFQDFNVFEELTVKENLQVFLRYSTTIDRKTWSSIINDGLSNFQMEDRLNIKAKLLSGGERQRLAILRSFIKDTEVVFADEPSANIDEDNKNIIFEYFHKLKQEGKTVIIVSHDNSYIDIADDVYIIEDGTIKYDK